MKYKVCLSELKQRFSDLYFLFSWLYERVFENKDKMFPFP